MFEFKLLFNIVVVAVFRALHIGEYWDECDWANETMHDVIWFSHKCWFDNQGYTMKEWWCLVDRNLFHARNRFLNWLPDFFRRKWYGLARHGLLPCPDCHEWGCDGSCIPF